MHPLRPNRSTLGDSRGAALLEFAITLPVLLVLMAGLFDFALAFQRYQAVTNAAREGARMAILIGYSDTDVSARVAAYLAASGVPGMPTIVVTPETLVAGGAHISVKRVQVQVTHTFAILGPLAGLVGGSFGAVTLVGTSVMRTEVAAGG